MSYKSKMVESTSKIHYNPFLLVKENAANKNVTVAAIRSYIRTNDIDRKLDNAIVIIRPRGTIQRHACKFHSYFFVFKKQMIDERATVICVCFETSINHKLLTQLIDYMQLVYIETGNIGTHTLNYKFKGKILRQYSVIDLLILSLVLSVCCLPNIGFFRPCFAKRILNFVASDTFLLNLFAIVLNFIELSAIYI